MSKVFLSYAHEDRERALRVYRWLDGKGHSVWFDEEHLPPGYPVTSTIEQAIQESDYFVLFLTESAGCRPDWLRKELGLFLLKEDGETPLHVIPLKYEACTIPVYGPVVAPLSIIDLSDESDVAFERAMERLGGRVGEDSHKTLNDNDAERLMFTIDLAVRAGNTAMQYYNSVVRDNESLDSRKNFATRADRAAQNCVIRGINASYGLKETEDPETIIAEEEDYSKHAVRPNGYTWVVDPLDGTLNFMNRIPLFCTAIGVLKDGDPHLGVIFDPAANEVYYAVEGHQSRVWRISTGETQLMASSGEASEPANSVVGLHISSREEVAAKLFENGLLFRLSKRFQHTRQLGCGQLALAYVASGRLQGFFQLDTYLWDMVAGIVLVKNAGGVVRDPGPPLSEWSHSSHSVVACASESVLEGFRDEFERVQAVSNT